MRRVIEEKGFSNIRVIQTGCFGLCSKGPIVSVRPEDTFYSHVKIEDCEDIINAVGLGLDDNRKGRWYDIDSTVRTAMNMLQNCPEATQRIIAKEMAKMVVDKMNTDETDE